MEVMETLSRSLEDYLETILVLELDGDFIIHSIDIAKRLGVSKPAVSRTLKHLANLGYITKATYSTVSFTPKGRNLARSIYYRHNTIKKFLLSIGVSQKIAENDCCKIEHVISNETLRALAKLNKN